MGYGQLSALVNEAATEGGDSRRRRRDRRGRQVPLTYDLELLLTDREVIEAIVAIDDDHERAEFIRSALRLGVLALRQAKGEIDALQIRHEGERLVQDVRGVLREHTTKLSTELAGSLREYLDPAGGKFAQRVEKLLGDDGELEVVMRRHVGAGDSALARTLASHVGEQSPLLRALDPEDAASVQKQIEDAVQQALLQQRDRILAQFSLDDQNSALARLVERLTDANGKLRGEFTKDVDRVVQQFTLDDEGSALSRLVRQVERASGSIIEQFSLDDDGSALSRLRRELGDSIGKMQQDQQRFQSEVQQTLAALNARRQTEQAGTAHGVEFEGQLGSLLQDEINSTGDLLESVGARAGRIRHCKKGDFVVEIGPEHAAAGRKIVVEAKDSSAYDDRRALDEIDEARRNRGADIGIFVWSRSVAGERTPIRRVGEDLLVVWDPSDPRSDVFVTAALSVAKALVVRRASPQEDAVDLEGLERAVLEIERQSAKLDTISRSGENIQGSARKILDEARKMRASLEQQVDALRAGLGAARDALGSTEPRPRT